MRRSTKLRAAVRRGAPITAEEYVYILVGNGCPSAVRSEFLGWLVDNMRADAAMPYEAWASVYAASRVDPDRRHGVVTQHVRMALLQVSASVACAAQQHRAREVATEITKVEERLKAIKAELLESARGGYKKEDPWIGA